jgi:hypothetical protein
MRSSDRVAGVGASSYIPHASFLWQAPDFAPRNQTICNESHRRLIPEAGHKIAEEPIHGDSDAILVQYGGKRNPPSALRGGAGRAIDSVGAPRVNFHQLLRADAATVG